MWYTFIFIIVSLVPSHQVSNYNIKCCIIGINSVCFDEESKHIIAMKSLEGEVVPFKNKVLLSNNVEVSCYFGLSLFEIKQTSRNKGRQQER